MLKKKYAHLVTVYKTLEEQHPKAASEANLSQRWPALLLSPFSLGCRRKRWTSKIRAIFLCVSQGPNKITFPGISAFLKRILVGFHFLKGSRDQDNTDLGSLFPAWHDHLCRAGSSRPFKTHKVSLCGQGTLKVTDRRQKNYYIPKDKITFCNSLRGVNKKASTPTRIAGTSKETQKYLQSKSVTLLILPSLHLSPEF